MKKLIFVLTFLLSNIVFSQVKENSIPFSKFEYGIYGGMNFETFSKIGGTFLIEFKTNLISNLNLNLSAGYQKSYKEESYTVKSYSTPIIDNIPFYYAEEYNVYERGYDVFPVSVGCQYIFKEQSLSPYFLLGMSYNFIDSKIYSDNYYSVPYNNVNAIPEEYKTGHTELFPDNSYSILIGIGAGYTITTKLNLDLRYFYKYDNEIINTHHLIVGVYF